MLTAYMRRLIVGYLANIAARVRYRSPEGRELVKWVLNSADILNLPGYGENTLLQEHARSEGEIPADEWRRLLRILATEHRALRRVRCDLTARRVRSLGRYMCLSRTDIALLEFVLRYETQPVIESLVDEILCHHGFNTRRCRCLSVTNVGLSYVLGVSPGTLRRRLGLDSPLAQSGLLSVEDDGDFDLLHRLSRLAHAPTQSGTDVQKLLFDEAPAAELEWQDFDHVSAGRDHVESLISGALETGERGVNVLLYGPPGTGKTQFCRTLAQRLGVTMYSVGEADERGREPKPGRAAPGTAPDAACPRRMPQCDPAVRRDGRPALGARFDVSVVSGRDWPKQKKVRRLQGVHEPAAGNHEGSHSVDDQCSPSDLSDGASPHDVCVGVAPAIAASPRPDLDPAT